MSRLSKNYKPYRHLNTGATKRACEAKRADHREDLEEAPAPRVLPWRVQMGSWADQPRAYRDNHKRRDQKRRQQKRQRQQERGL